MQPVLDLYNPTVIFLITLLLLVFSLVRLGATWRYRVHRDKESELSSFSRLGETLANGGSKGFNGLNILVAIIGHGAILTVGVYIFLEGDGVGFLIPIILTIFGAVVILGFIQFSGRGKRWYENYQLEREYYATHCDDSVFENKIESLIETINEGNQKESSAAITELEHILRMGYKVGSSARNVLSTIDPELFSEYKSTHIRRISRFKATALLLIIVCPIYLLSLLSPYPLYYNWSIYLDFVFRTIMPNYFIQPVLLVFGYEGSLDTKFV
ncbi:MAG: hypothetical protein KAR33_05355 [Candidatus Thorarchaeota archaeon]|nr:hypothetical protein [Candidatus Thorarchaeota archaeon]